MGRADEGGAREPLTERVATAEEIACSMDRTPLHRRLSPQPSVSEQRGGGGGQCAGASEIIPTTVGGNALKVAPMQAIARVQHGGTRDHQTTKKL